MIADAHNFPTRIVFARVIDALGARVYNLKAHTNSISTQPIMTME